MAQSQSSAGRKIENLKQLLDEDLISSDEFEQRRSSILDAAVNAVVDDVGSSVGEPRESMSGEDAPSAASKDNWDAFAPEDDATSSHSALVWVGIILAGGFVLWVLTAALTGNLFETSGGADAPSEARISQTSRAARLLDEVKESPGYDQLQSSFNLTEYSTADLADALCTEAITTGRAPLFLESLRLEAELGKLTTRYLDRDLIGVLLQASVNTDFCNSSEAGAIQKTAVSMIRQGTG